MATKNKVAVFLSVLGSKMWSLLRNFVAPFRTLEKSFDELVETLQKHFKPYPFVIAEIFLLFT